MSFTADTLIRDVVAACPAAAMVFERRGLGCAHCLAASMESLSDAASVHDISLESLLGDLNELNATQAEGGVNA